MARDRTVTNYIFALTLFLNTVDTNLRVIKDAYESDNIRLFTIKVHAMKSSARIIGAKHLASMAEEMENAGNNEDKEYIIENVETLLLEYTKYKENLSRIHDSLEDEEKEIIPENELKEAYRSFSDLIPQMDYDSVEMILDNLKNYTLPPEDDIKIKEAEVMLRNFDWDGLEAWITEEIKKWR